MTLGKTLRIPALGGTIRIAMLEPGTARIIFEAGGKTHVAAGPEECRALAGELLSVAYLLEGQHDPDTGDAA
jgi:hypothetical protein